MESKMKPKMLGITLLFLLVGNLLIVSAISIKDVSTSPEEVVPGEVVTVSIEIENIFEYDVANLNVKLDLEDAPFAPYQSSSEKFLEDLDEGDEETFRFKLITLPETDTGIYKIPVKINYEYGDENDSLKQELISVTVNSKPELKVSLEDSIVLIKGKENVFSVKIVNSGLADVKFVYLKANNVNGIKFLSEKEQYIGEINSDDFDNVEYKAHISAEASGTINLPIVLTFRDATNKEFTETQNVVLKIYSLQEAQKLGLIEKPNYTIYVLGGIVVLGYIFFRIKKKRKLKAARS
jgi:hypothetical protein